MAWTSPRTWVAAETVTAALMNTHVRDNLKAIGDAWASYGPTLTGWTLGNGTLTGASIQAGKLIHFRGRLTVGSTTTPSGTLAISLPATPSAALGDFPLGSAVINDATGSRYLRWCTYHGSGNMRFADASAALVNATVPFTFATGDTVEFNGSYESA